MLPFGALVFGIVTNAMALSSSMQKQYNDCHEELRMLIEESADDLAGKAMEDENVKGGLELKDQAEEKKRQAKETHQEGTERVEEVKAQLYEMKTKAKASDHEIRKFLSKIGLKVERELLNILHPLQHAKQSFSEDPRTPKSFSFVTTVLQTSSLL